MHFIPDDGKLAFLQSIAQRLKQKAPFILVDIFGKKGTPEFERIITYIQSHWQEMGITEANRKEMLATFEKGIYSVEEAHVYELLQQAGFTNVTRFYTGLWVGGWVGCITALKNFDSKQIIICRDAPNKFLRLSYFTTC